MTAVTFVDVVRHRRVLPTGNADWWKTGARLQSRARHWLLPRVSAVHCSLHEEATEYCAERRHE